MLPCVCFFKKSEITPKCGKNGKLTLGECVADALTVF